jgi:WD40 repeat protein
MAALLAAQALAACGAAAPPDSATKPAPTRMASASDGAHGPRVVPTNLFTAAFSPDGEALLVGTFSGHVHAFESRSGLPLVALRGHQTLVTALCVGDSGVTLSGDDGGDIVLWGDPAKSRAALKRATPTLLPAEHRYAVTSLAVSPDGKTLVSADRNGNALIWDLGARKVLHRLPAGQGPGDEVLSYGFDQRWAIGPGGKAVSWSGSRVTLWSLDKGKPLGTLGSGKLPERVDEVRFGGDGAIEIIHAPRRDSSGKLAVSTSSWSWKGELRQTGQALALPAALSLSAALSLPAERARLVFSRAGDRVAVVSFEGLDVIETATGRAALLRAPADPDKPATADEVPARVEVPEPRAGGAPKVDFLGNPLPPHSIARIGKHTERIVDIVPLPDGESIVVSYHAGLVRRWSIAKGTPLADAQRSGVWRARTAWSERGIIASFEREGILAAKSVVEQKGGVLSGFDASERMQIKARVELLDPITLETKAKVDAVGSLIAISRDGKRALLLDDDEFGVWDLERSSLIGAIARLPGDDGLAGAAFSPDGRLLAASGNEGRVRFFDTQTRELVGTCRADAPIAFAPDGRRLFVSARQGSTMLALDGPGCNRPWQTEPGASVRGARVVSADGKIVASTASDGVRFHDAGTGALVGRIPMERLHIERMAFSADRKRLFTDGEDATVLVWDTSFLP